MEEDLESSMEQIDYQCLMGGSSAISVRWLGSTEEVATVADWYRRRLVGYEEQRPMDWIRRRPGDFDAVRVGPADEWPAGVPAPARAYHGFRTLVMKASGVSAAQPGPTADPPAPDPAPRPLVIRHPFPGPTR